MVRELHEIWYSEEKNQTVIDFEKDLYNLLNNAFYGKTMENVRNGMKVEFIKKDDTEKVINKIVFTGTHKSFANFHSYTFKQNEILMDKPS